MRDLYDLTYWAQGDYIFDVESGEHMRPSFEREINTKLIDKVSDGIDTSSTFLHVTIKDHLTTAMWRFATYGYSEGEGKRDKSQ